MSEPLRLLAVHAHADDESITMGATLAVYHDRGVHTAVICCTDGKVATIVAEDMPEETTRPRLAAIRQDELRAACAAMGVDEVHFLGYGDSGMADSDFNNDPSCFWRADLNEAVQRLVGHIRTIRPHVVVTYDGNGGYGHPDHIQTHRATLLAVEAAHLSMYPQAGPPWQVQKLYYTAFPRSEARKIIAMAEASGMPPPFGTASADDLPFVTDDHLVTTAIDAAAGLSRKRQALLAHHSQIPEDWPMLSTPEEVMRKHFGHEYFQLAISRSPAMLPETDLFSGVALS